MNTLQRITRPGFLWLMLSLAAVATILLVACGGTSSSPSTTQAAPSTPTQAATPTTAAMPTAAATATSQPTTAAAATKVVQVKIVEVNEQYSFQPATLTIPKGAQVVWTNNSDAPHTVTSDTNAFGTTSNLDEHQTFMATFTTAGTFTYHCAIHTYMKGTITVTS
jgi:plastocyanin